MDGQQLLLEFNPDRAPCRKNYSISHELVHTFFDDCFEMVHQRKSDPRAFDPQQEVEHLCQVGAAEILMPEEDFLIDLSQHGFTLNAIPELCDRYQASREAVARRMLSLSDQTAALVFLSRRLKPVEMRNGSSVDGATPTPKMRILYGVQTPDFPAFMPKHKSSPDNSCVYDVRVANDIASGYEEWNVNGLSRVFVEAMALPIPETADASTPSVMALFFTNK